VSAAQFYETRVLLTSAAEATQWLWIMTSPPTVATAPQDVPAEWIRPHIGPREVSEAKEPMIVDYELLVGEASHVFPVPPDRLDEALGMLIETTYSSRRSAIAKYRYWFGPDSAREPLRRAREARQRLYREKIREWEDAPGDYDEAVYERRLTASPETLPSEYEFTWQAAMSDIVPLEASPLLKTSITRAAKGGAVAVCFFTGGPVMMITGAVGLVAVEALGKVGVALWQGAQPEVAEFGGDLAATLLDAIRARLGIPRRKERER
jgi:hypothetical protein